MYQEALLVVTDTQEFLKVCDMLTDSQLLKLLKNRGIELLEIGKFRKRVLVYPKGSCFLWVSGERGDLRDVSTILGVENSELLRNTSLCFCENLRLINMKLGFKRLKVFVDKNIEVIGNTVILKATIQDDIEPEVVEWVVNKKV